MSQEPTTATREGEQETNARWTAHLSGKEEEIVRLQKELKETRAAMRILSERKESDGKK